MEKILSECYNGDVSDKLYLYLSMIIANSEERKEIIRNNGIKLWKILVRN